MALKSAQNEPGSAADIEERLDLLDKTVDRVKTLYEQYFLGIQKQPPSHLHTDCERKLRDLTQIQIRNTALRYRFNSIQSKFSSYNTYWRRTLRQIEAGTYHRNLSKIGRQAATTGAEIPEEILAAMPKRMREQVKRDREAALSNARRRDQLPPEPEELSLDDADLLEEEDAAPAWISETTELRRNMLAARVAAQAPAPPKTLPPKDKRGAHLLDEADGDLDLDALFASVTTESDPPPPAPAPRVAPGKPVGTVPVERKSGPVSPSIVAAAAAAQDSGIPQAIEAMDTVETGEIPVIAGPQGMTGGIRVPTGLIPRAQQTGSIPRMHQTAAIPRLMTPPAGVPTVVPPQRATPPAGVPRVPMPERATPPAGVPRVPMPARPFAPSQASRPNPIVPGSSAGKSTPVESMSGPFPRAPVVPARPVERPEPPPKPLTPPAAKVPGPTKPPPGMTDADVNALYAKYVKAKEMVGEATGPGSYGKLLKTINAQAPKIMEQYNAKAVDFSVVVKDNQVIIRAKPKT